MSLLYNISIDFLNSSIKQTKWQPAGPTKEEQGVAPWTSQILHVLGDSNGFPHTSLSSRPLRYFIEVKEADQKHILRKKIYYYMKLEVSSLEVK